MEEITEQKKNKYPENVDNGIEKSVSQQSDYEKQVERSAVGMETVLGQGFEAEFKDNAEDDAPWEEEDMEGVWSMGGYKDERTEAEKSWDLSAGDKDFWSLKSESKLNETDTHLKSNSSDHDNSIVTCDTNVTEPKNTPVCGVLQETARCHIDTIVSDQNRNNCKQTESEFTERSGHISKHSLPQKDSEHEACAVKYTDHVLPTKQKKIDSESCMLNDEQAQPNDKSLPADSDTQNIQSTECLEDSEIVHDDRNSENIEKQFETEKQQSVEAVQSGCLENITETDQSEELSLDPQCFDEVDGNVLVINDSDNESKKKQEGRSRNTKWRPVLKRDLFPVVEHLQLSLEEAFFLTYGLGCLVVKDKNQEALGLCPLWSHFCTVQKTFLPNYIAYHYYRSKGWVPKSGLKFGSDFILYREGPPFYHGSYSVIVRLVDEDTLQDSTYHNNRNLSWTSLSGLNRITEHVAKELLICYVIKPRDITPEKLMSPKCIPEFSVQELHVTRWISSQEREKKEVEEFP